MTLSKQEDLVSVYRKTLKDASFAQKHALLSLLSTFQELTLKDISFVKNVQFQQQSYTGSNTKNNTFSFDGKYNPESMIEFNKLFCEYFRDEILSNFGEDYHQELREMLASKFEDIKS